MIPEHWVVPTDVVFEHPPCAMWAHRDPVARSTFVLVAIALSIAIAAAGVTYVICALPASVA